jgi:hypothetical protein
MPTSCILLGTIFCASNRLEHIRILGYAFVDLRPVVHSARNDYEPGDRGMLLGRFDHCRKEEESQERGGESIDLETSTLY